jgi:hypothetical protein
MTEKARRQDGEEAREEREGLPAELAHELAPERDTQRDLSDLTGATTSETDDVPAPDAAIAGATESTASTETTERPRARRASRKASTAQTRATENASENATEDAAACATTEATGVTAMSAVDADRIELEAQGFSADEADRLIDVSKRLESSAEALASQAELKRLRFAQWLVERGILDEFSV